MVRWPTPQPSMKFLNFRFDLDPQPSLNIFKLQIWPGHEKMNESPTSPNILIFRLGLDMERWLTPYLNKQYKFQIWSVHGKMTNPPIKNVKFQIWPGHGKMNESPTSPNILHFRLCLGMRKMTDPYLTKQFKLQIGSGHGKMIYPHQKF